MGRIPWEAFRYFKSGEFDSKDKPGTGELMHPQVIFMLVALRGLMGKALRINSGFRTPEHNKAEGGAPHSAELDGMAVDVSTVGWTSRQRIDFMIYARKLSFNGVGVGRSFIHIDIKDRLASWRYSAGQQIAIPVGDEHKFA